MNEPEEQVVQPEQTNYEMGLITHLQYGKAEKGIGLTYIIKMLYGSITLFMPLDQVTQLIEQYNIIDINALIKQTCVMANKDNQWQFVRLI